MSNLFNYIYEEKKGIRVGNLLCGCKYGIYIFVDDRYCRIHEFVYHNGQNVNGIEYSYKGFIDLDNNGYNINNFDNCIVEIIRYRGVVCRFIRDVSGITMWCISYKKMCGDRAYDIELRPVVPSTLFTGEEYDVSIQYKINDNMMVKMWLDLKNNRSYLSTFKI